MRRIAQWKLDHVRRRRESVFALVGPVVVLAFACIVLVIGLAFVGQVFALTGYLA